MVENRDRFPIIPEERKRRMARQLLAWYRRHKRLLPWRGASPYGVWISETMLQQTQVDTVIPYYRRFMERFPSLHDLATAPVEEVLQYWAGMGYYARARNLHRAAQMMVAHHNGQIPDTLQALRSLPGIGRYTAGAILSIAFNQPYPIVDANVARVLSRVFGIAGNPKSACNTAVLWNLAEQLVPSESPGDFNQALMELGALICAPSDPQCARCPLLQDCVAGNSPDPTAFPEVPPSRKTVPVTHCSAVVQNAAGHWLVVQRPPQGLWGGLWEFPRATMTSTETPEEAARRAAKEVAGIDIELQGKLLTVKHAVTHHRITLHAFLARVTLESPLPVPHACQACRFVPLDQLANYPFSAPQAAIRNALQSGKHLSLQKVSQLSLPLRQDPAE
ncbi:MAG: A/G-specific adenine glycosylase [Chloroherpetonaceae bacterium]|nr:A/G-specific adenine glycosylase [Chthonomonadaceae bacterium]MDW8208299.1 A/G-specific adenine glycosylase [Chloroherpetonaceae bacterium]